MDLAKDRTTAEGEVQTKEMQMLAKGMAMQQAGILPPNMDIEAMVVQAEHQCTLEGLLKGY